MEGWIKLHRKILNNEIWNDPTAFRLFILLLLNASHEDGRKINGIELKRGQWIRSYSKLSEDLGYRVGRGVKNVSRSTVSRTIEKLKSNGMVTVDETDSGTLFTITNYQYYQGFASDEEVNSGTVSGTKAEQRRNKGGTKAEPKQELKNERIKETIITTTSENPFRIFEAEGFGTISSFIAERINGFIDDYGERWTCEAMREAVFYGKRNLSYVQAILERWRTSGIDEPWKAKKSEENKNNVKQFNRSKSKQSNKPKPVMYTPTKAENTELSEEEMKELQEIIRMLDGSGG